MDYGYLHQACRFAFGKKTQAKKTQAKLKLKGKTPKKLKKIIKKLNLPEIFDPTLHSISLKDNKMSIFNDFTKKLRIFAHNSKIIWKKSTIFSKTQTFLEKLKVFRQKLNLPENLFPYVPI